MTRPLQSNLLELPLAPAQSVVDKDLNQLVKFTLSRIIENGAMHSSYIVQEYIDYYRSWILSSKLNSITGLDKFTVAAYSNGTSESFDKFYLKNSSRQFRCFRGEYLYHSLAWNSSKLRWKFLDLESEDIILNADDALIISLPFADTGNRHLLFTDELLDECYQLGIPVLIDCAFFGVCANLNFNFDHPAITDICFSLSKSFPVSTLRIGIRFTRYNDCDSLLVYNKSQYINKLGVAVGLELMKQQTSDYIFEKYRGQQEIFCKQIGLSASNTVLFGLDNTEKYSNYNRGMRNNNRICFSTCYNSPELINNI